MFYSKDISFTVLSLGCSKNLVDSERINGDMVDAGFISAKEADDAAIVIINTCGFITAAKEESIETIFNAIDSAAHDHFQKSESDGNKGLPSKRFGRKIVAVGCLIQRYFHEIEKEIPELAFLYGVVDSHFVTKLCAAFDIVQGGNICGRRASLVNGLSYAYIKIADGCSNNCSYCAIPLIRGTHRSFSPKVILQEVSDAVERGALEMDIVAQDITSYRYGSTRIHTLVRRIATNKQVRWVRLLYCHPDHIDDHLIECIAKEEKIVRYLDIPFQHASGKILRSMGRRGDAETYSNLIERIRSSVPGIRIRSTFMVGYPGETEKDFEALLEFLTFSKIDKVGAFTYSPEGETRAFSLKNHLPEKLKRSRYKLLMNLQRKISLEKLEAMIGTELAVIVEEKLDDCTFIGRSEFDAPEVDGIFYLTAQNIAINSIVRARITGCTEYDCMGVLV